MCITVSWGRHKAQKTLCEQPSPTAGDIGWIGFRRYPKAHSSQNTVRPQSSMTACAGRTVTSSVLPPSDLRYIKSSAVTCLRENLIHHLSYLLKHRAETPLTPPPSLICSPLLEDANHSRGAVPTLSPILLGPVFSAGLGRPTRESTYLVVPTWLSSQAHSKARSRIWS